MVLSFHTNWCLLALFKVRSSKTIFLKFSKVNSLSFALSKVMPFCRSTYLPRFVR